MASDVETPPDLLTAGGTAEMPETGGLVDALRSRGTMPAGLLEALAPPAVSPATTLYEAVAGGLTPGKPNPAVQQRIDQQQTLLNQTLQAAHWTMQERARQAQQAQQEQMRRDDLAERQRQHTWQQNKTAWDITQKIMDDSATTDEQRRLWAPQRQRLAKTLFGLDMPLEIASRDLSPKEQDDALLHLKYMGFTPEMVQRRYPKLTPEGLAYLQAIPDSEELRKRLGLPTVADQTAKAQKLEADGLDLLYKRLGLHGDAPAARATIMHAQQQYGKAIAELTPTELKDVLKYGESLVGTSEYPAGVKEALAASGLPLTERDPATIQRAVTDWRLKKDAQAMALAAQRGQMTTAAQLYGKDMERINSITANLAQVDILTADMDRLIDEGKKWTSNPVIINKLRQGGTAMLAGPGSEALSWMRRFQQLDSKFANVAKAIEGITGNRLAVANTERALGFHPKMSDPYTAQRAAVQGLKKAVQDDRRTLEEDKRRTLQQYGGILGTLGVPDVTTPTMGSPLVPTSPTRKSLPPGASPEP